MRRILDACCGSRMFWFNRENPDVEFCDIREADNELIYESKDKKDQRHLTIHPTTKADFTNLSFPDNSFYHVVFDPPHLLKVGENAWNVYASGYVNSSTANGAIRCAPDCLNNNTDKTQA